jgi:hypothetical protein
MPAPIGIRPTPASFREQIITIDDLLAGKKPNMPPTMLPYIQAAKRSPADTSTAFTRLGPNLKAQGFDAYNNFWSSFQRVTAQDASSDDGGSTVQVTVTFDRGKGPTTEEVHRLAMLASDSGPLIDTDTLVSSRKGK